MILFSVEFHALDYTRGGKVSGFARQHGCMDKVVTFEELVECRWQHRLAGKSIAREIKGSGG